MKITHKSNFKDQVKDLEAFNNWVERLETQNQRKYERFELTTALGKTHVWGLNTKESNLETLVIFPGARTTSLIWDLDKGLDNLNLKLRIFMVETNGLPNLSDGETPDIRSLDYGTWAAEVFEQLHIESAFVAGASFGGLICMKLALVNPEQIKAAFLLNAGCLQRFSLSLKNIFYNLLPIIIPTRSTVLKFLDEVIFCKPNHLLSETAEDMLIEYELFAIKRYKDRTQKPYYMDKELDDVTVDTYLLEGDKDLLFPYQKSIINARDHIKSIVELKVYSEVGHGIETYDKALNYIGEVIENTVNQ